VTDALVLGAGLAGLAAARDLAAGGTDVVVLEARTRVGGRVEQVSVDERRPVQLGGELVGPVHAAYLELVEELGLSLEQSYTAVPGATTYDLLEGVVRSADGFPFASSKDRADYERVDRLFAELTATVDPGDPWSHPEGARLDDLSVGAWLRSVDARQATIRALETGALSLAAGSIEKTSFLSELRKAAAVGERGFDSYYELWESLQVAEGSAEVALRMAAELGERIRLGTEARSVEIAAGGCVVTTAAGEHLRSETVVCALPVSVLAGVRIEGVDPDRVESLRRQRHALAAKLVTVYGRSVWADLGANGLAEGEHLLASTWPQRDGVLSGLVPPERIAWLLAVAEDEREAVLHGELERMYGEAAREPAHSFLRLWGTDPFTRGYVTHWWPGDVMRVGPLHGTHAPPFYVCGSDQWVAGYMEGAVRTGRAAAAAALGSRKEGRWVHAS
jgi:monoamine oxidase